MTTRPTPTAHALPANWTPSAPGCMRSTDYWIWMYNTDLAFGDARTVLGGPTQTTDCLAPTWDPSVPYAGTQCPPNYTAACTEAVETEIGTHYNDQIRVLLETFAAWEDEGYDVGEELGTLVNTLRRIRDEELEHLDHAVEHDAKKAEPHWLLTGIIRAGCRGAIWASEKV